MISMPGKSNLMKGVCVPRIPYLPHDLAEPKEIVDAVRARRRGQLLNLDRMLLHSPALAKGWNVFLGCVRNGLELSPRLRELAMCVVAVLNDAEYEFHHHAPEFIKAGGTPGQVEALRHVKVGMCDVDLFDARERAAIQLAIEMTHGVQVKDSTFAAARSSLQAEQLVVELVGVIATYNMVSRFLVALQIEPEDQQ